MAPAPASSGRIRPWLVVGDLVLAALWVCAGALVKLFVYSVLGLGGTPEGEAAKVSLSVVYMFIFAGLESLTGGASYNPLTALSGAVASHGGPALYLFTVFLRVPAQVRRASPCLSLLSTGEERVAKLFFIKGGLITIRAAHSTYLRGK
jgi:aquaporin SIP